MSLGAVRKLEGKVAVLTASTSGIGYSIAKKLAMDGAKVMLSSRKSDNVERAVKQLRSECEGVSVEGVVCHVGKDDHRKNLIKETVSKFGRLDILVSNAAVNPMTEGTLMTSESAWDKIFEVNVKAAALLVKEAHPHLVASGSGAVVFVSSAAGYVPNPFLGAYSASKSALLGLTKALAEELAPDNIRVNCIAPALFSNMSVCVIWKDPLVQEIQKRRNPTWRIGETDECAGAVAFLCSDEASYITGETIPLTTVESARL
ncbi:dehydrogenase/reductase SDR family member 4-like [Halichondria panicea]|uniref:dehydrogenase/reductase SDR family member 4-like n=1 Tax=Halichondria panicea TaxID=6063 RepID=UPI00312B5B1E